MISAMKSTLCSLILIVAWAFAPVCACANPPFQLADVEYIDCFTGSNEAKALLAEQGFVVTGQQFTQMFAAYLKLDESKPWLPNFITEDSAWQAYHVMLEEGLRQLEEQQAGVLRRFSARLVDQANAKSEKARDAYRDLAAFAAVGLTLQDGSTAETWSADLRAAALEMQQAIDTGTAPLRPLFFGLPIAPERFRVAGLYSKSPGLRGYFVARQWYATCCFRLKSSAETERAIRLALLVDGDDELKRLYEQLSAPYDLMLGPADDAGVSQYAELAKAVMGPDPQSQDISAALDAFRDQASRGRRPKVNDQLLEPEQLASFAAETQGFRLLPPRLCPSAVLLQRTSHPLIPGRMVPSGVDFFAVGPLACDAGRRALRASVARPSDFEAIIGMQTEPLPDSLHGRALDLLTHLQKPLPATAPAPLRTAAWQDKQLWTSLGVWAEQRHTWAAHIKLSTLVLDGDEQPPGYVSPYPEFFRGLGQLARQTADALARFRAEPDPKMAGQELLHALELDKARDYRGLSESDVVLIPTARMRLFRLHHDYCQEIKKLDRHDTSRWPDRSETLDRFARRWIDGKNLEADDRELIRRWALPLERDPVKLLPGFAGLCDRLAEIAKKELDRVSLDDKDVRFLRDYGVSLAAYHFYDDYAWMHPRDDFPQVTPIFATLHPDAGASQMLYAGLGRPEALYVVLNVGGKWVLHRGAVLSYREFLRPASESVDDETWTKQVRRGEAPAPPAFTGAFRRVTMKEQAAESARLRQFSGSEDISAANGEAPTSAYWRVWLFLSAVLAGAIVILAAFKRQRRNSHGIEEPGPIERKDQ